MLIIAMKQTGAAVAPDPPPPPLFRPLVDSTYYLVTHAVEEEHFETDTFDECGSCNYYYSPTLAVVPPHDDLHHQTKVPQGWMDTFRCVSIDKVRVSNRQCRRRRPESRPLFYPSCSLITPTSTMRSSSEDMWLSLQLTICK